MRWTTVVQIIIFLAVLAGLAYVVAYVAEGWADWVVLAGMVVATYGVIVAYHNRRYPHATEKRTIRREPGDSYLPSSKQGRG